MYVQLQNDDIVFCKLAENPTLRYTDTELNVTTESGTHYNYPIGNIRSIQYSPKDILSSMTDLPEGFVMIYSITGQHIISIPNFNDIVIVNIPCGVYILRTKDATKKVILN